MRTRGDRRAARATVPGYLLALVIAAAFSAACSGGSSARPIATAAGSADAGDAGATPFVEPLRAGTLRVFAAASLTDAFGEIATAFSAAHPGVDVTYNFGGSPTLRTQLEQGARADVLAVADQATMQAALDKQLVIDRGTTFANNRLVIIVPASNPAKITTPADLARPGVKLVLALAGVPAGTYARQSLAKMELDPAFGAGFEDHVLANVVSEEPNVKAVVTKVQLGEADAGIVYVTDVTPGVVADVGTITLPDAYNVTAAYPIAVTRDAARPDIADAFIRFVLSTEGQAILRKYAFLPPK